MPNDTLEGGVKESELNMNAPVQDIVKEYETKVHERSGDPADPIPREHMEPTREMERNVRIGRANAQTGAEIPPTDKTRSAQVKQFGTVPQKYLDGYEAISWDD